MVPWYIHIQSSNHKSGNDFKVKVPHGLNACTRVASQNFSIPNSIGNTYGPFSKLIGLSYPFPVEIMGRGHSNDVCVCVCCVCACVVVWRNGDRFEFVPIRTFDEDPEDHF